MKERDLAKSSWRTNGGGGGGRRWLSTESTSVTLTKSCRDLIVRMVTRAPEVEVMSCPVYSARSRVFV